MVNHIASWLAASSYVISIFLSIACALGQTASQSPVSIEPKNAVRGQLVFIKFSSTVHLVRVFRVEPGRDLEVSHGANGTPQLVAIDEGTSYVFSTPHVGNFYVEAIRIEQEKNSLEILTDNFSIANDFPPEPPIPPVPVVDRPFPSPDGLRVIIVHETNRALPKEQAAILTSATVREWLSRHTVSEVNASGYRIWDDDYTDEQLQNVSEVWKTAYKVAREYLETSNAPAVVVASGPKGGLKMPLPDSSEELLKRLQEIK